MIPIGKVAAWKAVYRPSKSVCGFESLCDRQLHPVGTYRNGQFHKFNSF